MKTKSFFIILALGVSITSVQAMALFHKSQPKQPPPPPPVATAPAPTPPPPAPKNDDQSVLVSSPPSSAACPRGTSNPNDGCSGAPTGLANSPDLLNSYATRPSWNVAGVDYRTGITAGTVLKTPGVDSAPACVTVDSVNKEFVVNANNCVINGWDFTGGGGWSVRVDNPSNPVITNNRFIVGSNGYSPIVMRGEPNGFTGTGGTISNNEIDGQGLQGGFSSLIFLSRSGTFVIKYNWIKNAFEDLLVWGSGGSGGNQATYDARFNLIENGGKGGGVTHPDMLVTTADNVYGTFTIDYNTWVFNNSQGSQGLVLQGNTNNPLATFAGGSVSNNTFVFTITPGLINLGMAIAKGQTTGNWNLNNNFVDPTSLSPISLFIRLDGGGALSGTCTSTGNTNMLNNTTTGLNPC